MTVLTYLTTTHFDFGAVQRLPRELERLAVRRPLVTTDAGLVASGLLERLRALFPDPGAVTVFDGTPGNPTEQAVMDALAMYESNACDGVVGFGGGSSMDLGKAVALLAGSGGPLARFDPQRGGTRQIGGVASLVAVPTTAGTGSEVSVGTVIVLDDGRKLTFAAPALVPRVALCDPELTVGMPPHLTAATGMDAITHCIEAVLSPVVNPPADGVGLDGLWRGWRALEAAVADGSCRAARWQMMMASTQGAMAFVKGLGAVHAMSHALGRLAEPRLHHGTLNAVILPTVLRFNAAAVTDKMARIGAAMDLPAKADVAEAVEAMNRRIGLPAGLAELGVTNAMIEDLVPHALADLAARTNPRPVSAAQYTALFEAAL